MSVDHNPLEDCLFSSEIDLRRLRKIASNGIDDTGSHRGVAWRVLLGCLPLHREKWESHLAEQRTTYQNLMSEFFWRTDLDGNALRGHHSKRNRSDNFRSVQRLDESDRNLAYNESIRSLDPSIVEDESSSHATDGILQDDEDTLELPPASVQEKWTKSGRETQALAAMANAAKTKMNTLLHLEQDEQWGDFLENATLLDEIRKDVVRTQPDLYFFLEPHDNLGLRRYAAIERILFLWAKLNKGVRYVQGMNEIVGTLYYVLANDFNEEWATHAEPDTYYLFNTLMSDMRDIFVPDLDNEDTGIQGRIHNMSQLLAIHDPEVAEHLQDVGIDASFFAVRWLTTLLSREFLLPDTIRLWDSMLASTHKENFLRYVCVTMVMVVRDELLKGDFSTCLRLLQSYPSTNTDALLESSRALWIYESQITMACHKGGISLHQALQTVTPPPAILYAYGLRGGVALTLVEQIEHEAKEAVREAAQVAETAGWRVRRFFWRQGSDESPKTETNKAATAATSPATSSERGSRLGFGWVNRQRAFSNDGVTPSRQEPQAARRGMGWSGRQRALSNDSLPPQPRQTGRLGFGWGGLQKELPEPSSDSTTPSPASDKPPQERTSRFGFGWRQKPAAAPTAPDTPTNSQPQQPRSLGFKAGKINQTTPRADGSSPAQRSPQAQQTPTSQPKSLGFKSAERSWSSPTSPTSPALESPQQPKSLAFNAKSPSSDKPPPSPAVVTSNGV